MVDVIFLGFLTLLFIFTVYLMLRNNKVYSFCSVLSKMSYDYNMRRINERKYDETDAFEWFANKHSYFEFVLSFKPLKLEKWFTEEEITKINK